MATVAATLLAVFLIAIIILQWRAGRAAATSRQELREIGRLLGETTERQEGLAHLFSEGQARNLELLQSRFSDAIDTLNRQLGTVTSTLNEQLSQTRGNIGRELQNSRTVISQVQERLGELTSTARNIHELGRDISRLQDILQAPKLRGNLGELFLQELLAQVLPPSSYEVQYSFPGGEKVDAVIRLGDRLVPVDSKFPLESFNRMLEAESEDLRRKARREFTASVRRRIDEVAGKYIRPEHGTYDFALMYIPAENVFYETVIRDEAFGEEKSLFNYALAKHVIPVSPNSFYAYLAAVAYGLKGLHIEKRAKEIWGQLGQLRTGIDRFSEEFVVLGRHLDNARGKYGDADGRLVKLREALEQISGGEEAGGEPVP
jgi:DNA recombination protein RmuC